MTLDSKEWRDLKPDAQGFDKIIITTEPRFKDSYLSGCEWRISSVVKFYRKGKLIEEKGFRDTETAAIHLGATYRNLVDGGKGFFAGEGDICDQEGCEDIATNKLYKKFKYCKEGHKSDLHNPTYRMFCDRHKNRGDSSFDDSNENYTTQTDKG